MARTDRSLAKGILRPFVRPLLRRIETLESKLDSVQARMVELSHAQVQASSRQRDLMDAKQVLDVLERRVQDLEQQVRDSRRYLDDILEAVSQLNAVAREARRQSLQVEASLSDAVARIEKVLEMDVIPDQRQEP